jgi:hypothetical protein
MRIFRTQNANATHTKLPYCDMWIEVGIFSTCINNDIDYFKLLFIYLDINYTNYLEFLEYWTMDKVQKLSNSENIKNSLLLVLVWKYMLHYVSEFSWNLNEL